MMKLSEDEISFREEVREFIRAELPADIRHKVTNDLHLKKDDHVRWQSILREKGYYGASWPCEYGGSGWTSVQQYLFEQENALAGAPFIIPYGVNMVGPVIYTFGNESQKDLYLKDILDNKTWWCQGYSEPNAGSDLASLQCSAVRDGDEYVINGTKMWTTQAHYADMMHILVRTEDTGRRQEGITFLVLDMNTPGITISPITTIDGLHHTNQTFFDDVRVPVSQRIGEEGDGWKIAKFLLSNERTAIADTGSKARAVEAMKQHLVESSIDQLTRYDLAQRLAKIETRLMTLIALEQRLLTAWQAGQQKAHEASVLKVRATELQQDISVLFGDLFGSYKIAYDIDRVDLGEYRKDCSISERASGAGHLYLYGRCASIYGGSNQIQRNIIAKATLAN